MTGGRQESAPARDIQCACPPARGELLSGACVFMANHRGELPMRRIARLLLLLVPVFVVAACERQGPFERAGERVDRSVDRITR
jgi:hypothetical protein